MTTEQRAALAYANLWKSLRRQFVATLALLLCIQSYHYFADRQDWSAILGGIAVAIAAIVTVQCTISAAVYRAKAREENQ